MGIQLPLKGTAPNFRPHVCCGETAGWINMPLGTEAGLDPCDIVLDGDPAPLPEKGTAPPLFGPCLLWPNGRPSQQLLSSCLLFLLFKIPDDCFVRRRRRC